MKKHILLLSFSIVGLATIAPAQNQDPFAADQAAEQNKVSTKKSKAASHSNDGHLKIISICYETFSLSLADAAALRRKEFSDALLYQKILDGIKAGTAKQETFAIVRARSGERVMNENITEKIYPTEFEPPKIPNQLGIALSPSPSEEQPNPPIEEERIFQPFERVHHRASEGSSGTGLGLAIARDLATRMNGTLELLENKSGCTFRLTLPAKQTLSVVDSDSDAA